MSNVIWVPFFHPDKNEQQYRPCLAKDGEAENLQDEAPPEHQRISGWRAILAEQEAARL